MRPSSRKRPFEDAELRAIAGGGRLAPDRAAELLADGAARRRLAQIDPAAVFAALGALPPSGGIPPRPVLPAPAAGRRLVRRAGLFAAAAALIAAAALGVLEIRPAEPALLVAKAERLDPVVRRVDSETAQVITLVPPSTQGPTVTLIIDEGLDL